ncbi:uncharacterized protein VTP21DRAFT_1582 [Calcarisporiella thermophila]|uniref:uncharacterized protein n=1 Tax=Calcarisporiella thermophila TaxID=911321 RepID=UPI00374363F3
MLVDTKSYPYGIGKDNRPLDPFVSVASNSHSAGTVFYVSDLDGWILPDKKTKHNGCVRIDDEGWSLEKYHLDFFVVTESNYKYFDQIHAIENVDACKKDCELLNYGKWYSSTTQIYVN